VTRVRICDTTLRDGSHAKAHSFTVEEVQAVSSALDSVGLSMIEVSHGDGLGGSSYNYGFSATTELELIEAAARSIERATLAVLLLPGIGTRDDLIEARNRGASAARIATHCTEADIAPQHIALARELNMTTVGFLMMAHLNEPNSLAEQAEIMADAGAHVVYVTDSAGALLPDSTALRVHALRERLPDYVEVGFHGHQNLYLGVANSLAAVRAGATWIDTCTCGLGAGAGNTPTEVFAAVCERSGIETGIDVLAMMDVAEEVVRPLLPSPQVVNRAALILGYAGVYSSFLLHAERAAAQFGVSAKEILIEVGRRKAVGGQEDWIIDVATELARARTPA
jgi:4-hydroxy 2-oxovalerate aldolase